MLLLDQMANNQRLILDLRHVNQFLMVPSFRMDSLNLPTDLANTG